VKADEFRKELEELRGIFEKRRSELIVRFPGKFVAICEGEIAGVGDTYDEAVDEAWRRFGHGPIYVGRAVPEGEEETWLMV